MGWLDFGWSNRKSSKKDKKAKGGGVLPWYASGKTAKNWFRDAREQYQEYWRPKFVQPHAAALIQDGWTQSQGQDAHDATIPYGYYASPVFADAKDAGDFFSTCFEQNVAFARYTSRPIKAEFIQQVLASPEFESLRFQSRFDVAASHMGAVALAKLYQEVRGEESLYAMPEPKGGQESESQDGQGDGKDGQGDGQKSQQDQDGQDGDGDQDGKGGSGSKKMPQSLKDRIRKLAYQATKDAQQEIRQGRELARTFGIDSIGSGKGQPSKLEIEKFVRLYSEYKNKKWLQKVVRFAGRLQQIAKSRAKAQTLYGADSFGGTTLGDDVGRLTGDELAALGLDESEIDVLTRLSDEEAHCIQLVGRAEAGKGPIIMALDNSGSMGGHAATERVRSGGMTLYEKAAAIALTVAWIARSQHRWVGLYTFTDGPETRKLILDPNHRKKTDGVKLAEWITSFDNGGTNDEVIARVIPKDVDGGLLGKVRGKADLLVVSDGCIANYRSQENSREKLKDFKKKHDIRLKLILVGEYGKTTGNKDKDEERIKNMKSMMAVAEVADEIIMSDDITEGSKAAEAVFSLQD